MMQCQKCHSNALVRLSSIDKVLCADCYTYGDWNLKQGQQSVLIDGKRGTADEPEQEMHTRSV